MKLVQLILATSLGVTLTTISQAQDWPSKALHAIVPYGAGSTTDIIPRLVFEQLSPRIGRSIVVENRSGAGGTIGTGYAAKVDADGYTLLVNSNAHTIAPALYPRLGYDPALDFAAVIPLGTSASVLVVAPEKGFKTASDLIAAARAKPGGMTFASVGAGTATHLSAERFVASAGIQALHIPFRGGAEAMSETMVGRVDFFFGPVGLVLPLIKDGKLTALAVNSSKRSRALPDIPTTSEAGLMDAEYPIWFGIFLPAKTPRALVDKLHAETLATLQTPNLQAKLSTLGVDPLVMTPSEFDEYVRTEIAMNAKLVKAIGIKVD